MVLCFFFVSGYQLSRLEAYRSPLLGAGESRAPGADQPDGRGAEEFDLKAERVSQRGEDSPVIAVPLKCYVHTTLLSACAASRDKGALPAQPTAPASAAPRGR